MEAILYPFQHFGRWCVDLFYDTVQVTLVQTELSDRLLPFDVGY